ncbi:MAG: hypothetical protein E7447_00550 [Ruminococcaceae bacterium]|nr:hypothetical protein [Oscillospiraceae bacterium]
MFVILSTLLIGCILLGCISVKETKMEMAHRVLHIRYVFVTVLYVILCATLFAKVLDLINWIISLPLIRDILFFVTPPGNVAGSFYWIITLLCCLLLTVIYLALMNLLKKCWLQPLEKRKYLETKLFWEKFFNELAGGFYEIDDAGAKLSPKFYTVGRWIRAMRWGYGFFLLAEVLFITLYVQFNWTFLGEEFFPDLVKSLFMLPVLVYFLLEQVELFLAADRTKDDILVETEKVGMVQKGDFTPFVEEYQKRFQDKSLIAYHKGDPEKVRQSLFTGIQAEQKQRVQNPALLEALCRNVECATNISHQYVNGLIDLINGENIAVFDTPWGDFDPYYLSYVQHKLVLKNTVLVLCDSQLQVQRMCKRLHSVFTKLNRVCPIWRIHNMGSMVDGQTDVLVCTEEEFLSNPIDEHHKDFTKRLGVVVMLDAYGLLCRESAYSSRIFDFLGERKLQYIFYLPENSTDIRHRLQERIGCGEIQLRENPQINQDTHLMLWRADAIYKPQTVLSTRLYEDFGVAYAIAILASKMGATAVNILAPESVPLQTYYHLVTQKYTKELMVDALQSEAINLSNIIRNNDYSVAEPSQLNFCIVYDELNNLLDVAQTWLAYGGAASSMLHIVSPPYMLRDYFACNQSSLMADTTGLQMLIPKRPLGRRVPALALLLRMHRGVLCQDVEAFAKANQIRADRLEDIIKAALEIVFGDSRRYDIYTSFSFTECTEPTFDGGYKYTVQVKLINESLYKALCRMTEQFARLTGARNEMLPIHEQDIYNHYLPQQLVSFGNERYRVQEIKDGRVQISPEATIPADLFYTPLYDILDLKRTDTRMPAVPMNNKVVMDYFEAAVTRQITGFFAHPGMLDLTDKNATHLEKLSTPIVETKTVPCLQMEFSCPMSGRSDKIANTLCFLLKGALATFLPHNHKDLLVFSRLDMDKIFQGVNFHEDNGLLPDPIPSDLWTDFNKEEEIDPAICKLIPQITSDDVKENTDDKLYIYIAQFSARDTGALTAIAEDLDRILSTVLKYLKWSEAQKIGAPEYLRFGYEEVPGIFATHDTVYCLPNFFDHVPDSEPLGKEEDTAPRIGDKRCSFCGKRVSAAYTEMDDGRIMCPECGSHLANSREEVKQLLQQAIQILEKTYGITLPDGIKVKFKSASTIREHTQSNGRVLGFYNLKRKEIWIERNGPKACVLSTLLHELTHAWQHANISMDIELHYLEGHTSYVEVECMRLQKQRAYADFLNESLMNADDAYGQGYRLWKQYLQDESDKNIFHHVQKQFPKR